MAATRAHRLRLLEGLRPFSWSRVPPDVLAGVTLAALGIPEVLGYAKIAGMPVVTGLYTMLVPMAVFALFGGSRHLVVGADSATAAILAAGLAGTATVASPRWVALAGTAALVAGALLLVARVVRLGFIANFLSRTVLVGFLTGVGVQVATGQIAEMIGVDESGHGTIGKLAALAHALPRANAPSVLVSLAVVAIVLVMRKLTRRVPGALLAVVGAIVVSRAADLAAHGVATLGALPTGVPRPSLPALSLGDVERVLAPAVSMFVVILAQSSATSRAYASRHDERFDEDADLLGLALANVSAAFTGTFVVNGSPTKTEMVETAGGKSQLAQLATCAVVLVALLFFTGPLAYLPMPVLATIVFLIGVELVDVRGMRRIWTVRRAEFAVALLTAAAVVFLGVEQGIVLAIVASILDHLRHSYAPHDAVIALTKAGHWRSDPVTPAARTVPGLAIYRFGASLYYANAHRFHQEVTTLVSGGPKLSWLCLDFVAIYDVDYTAAAVLRRLHEQLARKGIRLLFCAVEAPVRAELDRYGIASLVGEDAFYERKHVVVDRFRAATASDAPTRSPTPPPATPAR